MSPHCFPVGYRKNGYENSFIYLSHCELQIIRRPRSECILVENSILVNSLSNEFTLFTWMKECETHIQYTPLAALMWTTRDHSFLSHCTRCFRGWCHSTPTPLSTGDRMANINLKWFKGLKTVKIVYVVQRPSLTPRPHTQHTHIHSAPSATLCIHTSHDNNTHKVPALHVYVRMHERRTSVPLPRIVPLEIRRGD